MRIGCVLVLVIGLLSGCSGSEGEPSDEAPALPRWEAAEDLRLGSLEGADGALTFGSLPEMAAMSDGGVLVLDGQARVVFLFSSAGSLIRTLGASGSGPGEFREVSGLAVVSDSLFVVRDPQRAVIFFDEGGELVDEWPVFVDYVGPHPLAWVEDRVLLRYQLGTLSVETFWEARLRLRAGWSWRHGGYARIGRSKGPRDVLGAVSRSDPRHVDE